MSDRKPPKKRRVYHDALPSAGMEVDYWDKLSPKEKDWLYRFNRETIAGRMRHPLRAGGKKRVSNGRLHLRKADRSAIWAEQWIRRHDIVNKGVRAGEHEIPDQVSNSGVEEQLVEKIDESRYRGFVPNSYYAHLHDGILRLLRTDNIGSITVDFEFSHKGENSSVRLSKEEYQRVMNHYKDKNPK